ncbi:hypothetical protein [Fluoribacter gormanii]|uniref:hypothetical protein n=1 Tax=Fluoribacter gormanii TaxID=464 RepID=UPI001040F487|nr:hypothetical protein [Fluoribacter gormanii]
MESQNPSNKIDNLNLDLIKKKLEMSNQEGGYEWPKDAIDIAINSYKSFLKRASTNILNNSEVLLQPEPIADIVWHVHILFTKKYHDDCNSIFGQYLHHQPKVI